MATVYEPKKGRLRKFIKEHGKEVLFIGFCGLTGGLLGGLSYKAGWNTCDTAYQKVLKTSGDAGLIKAHFFDGKEVNFDSKSESARWGEQLQMLDYGFKK